MKIQTTYRFRQIFYENIYKLISRLGKYFILLCAYNFSVDIFDRIKCCRIVVFYSSYQKTNKCDYASLCIIVVLL